MMMSLSPPRQTCFYSRLDWFVVEIVVVLLLVMAFWWCHSLICHGLFPPFELRMTMMTRKMMTRKMMTRKMMTTTTKTITPTTPTDEVETRWSNYDKLQRQDAVSYCRSFSTKQTTTDPSVWWWWWWRWVPSMQDSWLRTSSSMSTEAKFILITHYYSAVIFSVDP